MRLDPDKIVYAQALMGRGYGFQNASRMAGVSEGVLRSLCAPPRARVTAPPTRRRQEPQRPRPQAPVMPSDETLKIVSAVAERYGLTRADLIGEGRCRQLAYARHEAMSAVRAARPGLSLPYIGRIFGGRDHTTVIHGLRCHAARVAWGEALRAMVPDDQLDLFAVAA